jgi:hypothetical protein
MSGTFPFCVINLTKSAFRAVFVRRLAQLCSEHVFFLFVFVKYLYYISNEIAPPDQRTIFEEGNFLDIS